MTTESTTKYDVFISYSQADYKDKNGNIKSGNIISAIKDALSIANISYWIDETGLSGGMTFPVEIEKRISEAKVFLFVSSKNSNNSPWVVNEIAIANYYGKKIIPFRYDETAYAPGLLVYIASTQYTSSIPQLVDSISRAIKNKTLTNSAIPTNSFQKWERILFSICALIMAVYSAKVLFDVLFPIHSPNNPASRAQTWWNRIENRDMTAMTFITGLAYILVSLFLCISSYSITLIKRKEQIGFWGFLASSIPAILVIAKGDAISYFNWLILYVGVVVTIVSLLFIRLNGNRGWDKLENNRFRLRTHWFLIAIAVFYMIVFVEVLGF